MGQTRPVKLRYTVRPPVIFLESLTIWRQSPQGRRHVQERIHAITSLIVQHPEAGHRTGRRGTRRIVVSPYPYLIFYRLADQEVIIDAVRHAARDPTSMPGQ